jgi:hypothetical protein
MVLEAQLAVTPAGKPIATPIPVAPVVVCVTTGVSDVLIHRLGVEDATDTVFTARTVIVPVALTVPHPPVSGIL